MLFKTTVKKHIAIMNAIVPMAFMAFAVDRFGRGADVIAESVSQYLLIKLENEAGEGAPKGSQGG